MRKKILSRKLVSTIAAIILIAVIAAPVLASPATAARTLPASVTSGAEFDVAIEASGCGAFGQVVETVPGGFTYLSCSSGDIGVEQLGNTVKFTFLGDSASFSYTVRAPTVADSYTFGGIVKDGDLNEFPVTGDATITVPAPDPVTSRILAVSVVSGAEFDVAIETSGCGFCGQMVETLPNGFTYVSSSLPADEVEQIGNMVKFTFLGDSASFTYRVKAPRVTATTTYTFQGVVKDQDRISHPIEDDDVEVLVTSGIRTLPTSIASGAEFDVGVEASGCGAFGQVVETLPNGFTYVSSSLPADEVEQIGNMVKFTFLGDSASFTYRVKAPRVTATTTYAFQGTVGDEDRISYPIEDDDITVICLDTGDLTNVELVEADPTVMSISIHSYPTEDLTNVPAGLDVQSAYIVDSEGSGSFVLRFNDIAKASTIVVYKVVDSTWTELPVTVIDATTVEVTMEAGDPPIVFCTPTGAPPPLGGEGYFPNVASLLAPWIALGVVLISVITWFVVRRHNA